ncbi:MAG: DNA cytosine methyltransferase [Phycisphaeraceae bacterium]|nr:DNA cytosine methyltransferase [Phycisphaeraceae bacterium]MCB9848166.1 DNA cytosine methyltransferase [Phycisphaeraceae bacterium]
MVVSNQRIRSQQQRRIRAIDMFCGAGGSSWGAKNAGCEVIAGFDQHAPARNAFSRNFPRARIVPGAIEQLQPETLSLGRVDLILASPECTNHSPAKGAAARSERSRATALQVARFAALLEPRWIIVENVINMRNWHKYKAFCDRLRALGYNIRVETLNAADFGVPQVRRRLFLLCDREKAPNPVKISRVVRRDVTDVLDDRRQYQYTPLRQPSRARATLERAERAFATIGASRPFLIVYYGSDGSGGWQRLDVPLRTVTTIDRFALVRPRKKGHVMRMLQPTELKRAMGMPGCFFTDLGSRRESIRAIGNAVCPPVMRAAVRSLTATD